MISNDFKGHLARERRLSAWLARVISGEPVACRAIGVGPPPPRPSRRKRVRLHDELGAKSGGDWTRGDRA